MSSSSSDAPIAAICLGGPTGCGKSALAIGLARIMGCEIINADSRQMYADFPIITAQPNPREQEGIPHHLYGFLRTDEKMNAGRWQILAVRKAREIMARGKIPLFVGGTGFYLSALLDGIAPIPAIDCPTRRRIALRMAELGPEVLHDELAAIDPDYAAKIHPRDRQRVQRALEVFASTGKTFSWWHKNTQPLPPFAGPLLIAAIPLDELAPVLYQRIEKMLDAGAMAEAKTAYARYPSRDLPGWSGIGCGEIFDCISGKTGFEECRRLWQASTRAYAKRQLTWFRARKKAVWLDPRDSLAVEAAVRVCQENFSAFQG